MADLDLQAEDCVVAAVRKAVAADKSSAGCKPAAEAVRKVTAVHKAAGHMKGRQTGCC